MRTRSIAEQRLDSLPMIDETDAVVVMEASPPELERVAARLKSVGIDSTVVAPETGKGSS